VVDAWREIIKIIMVKLLKIFLPIQKNKFLYLEKSIKKLLMMQNKNLKENKPKFRKFLKNSEIFLKKFNNKFKKKL